MATVDLSSPFNSQRGTAVTSPRVYTRTTWGGAWQENKALVCTMMRFAIAPDIGSATFEHRYGVGYRGTIGESRPAKIEKIDTAEIYLRVDKICDVTGTVVSWYGIGSVTHDEQRGFTPNGNAVAYNGIQHISAVGLEKLLDDTPVRSSLYYHEVDKKVYQVDHVIPFNKPLGDAKVGANRAEHRVDRAAVFTGKVAEKDKTWTTYEILLYLVELLGMRDSQSIQRIKCYLHPDTLELLKSINDQPVFDAANKSLRTCLNELLPPQRMLSWNLIPSGSMLAVRVYSLAGRTVDLPTGILKPNLNMVDVINTSDRSGSSSVITSHLERVERVRCRGARATTTGTFSKQTNTIEAGWTQTLGEEFNAGASGEAGYSAANDEEKKRMNDLVRSSEEYRNVFTRYRIPDNFTGTIDGENIVQNPYNIYKFKLCPSELIIEQSLPMVSSATYAAGQADGLPVINETRVGKGPHEKLPPQCYLQKPDESGYVLSSKMSQLRQHTDGKEEKYDFTATVMIPDNDRAVHMQIDGAEQYAIASDYSGTGFYFDPLPVEEKFLGTLADWKEAYFVLCIRLDYFCEGVWPDNQPNNRETVREMLLNVGDQYRLDWVAANTVTGLSHSGDLLELGTAGWLKDDRKKLTARAKLAYSWYGETRRAIQISSAKFHSGLRAGYLVRQYTSQGSPITINSIITAVEYTHPSTTSGAAMPGVRYETQFFTPDLDSFEP
jgi:hypothetical protein